MADGSPVAMMFWDEVPWDVVGQLDARSLALVDHNKMTEQVAAHFDSTRVTHVLDHHAGGDDDLGSCWMPFILKKTTFEFATLQDRSEDYINAHFTVVWSVDRFTPVERGDDFRLKHVQWISMVES